MDLQIIETGSGGDLVETKNDLSVIEGFQSMIYMALFGGNVEASTKDIREVGELAFDYWGNWLLAKEDSANQFNSETERMLMSVSIRSAGRLKIIEAVKKDLTFLSDIATLSVDAFINADDRITIEIKVNQTKVTYIWDATLNELSDK